MPSEYRARRRVEFAETDMAGIVHFANFFRWMESTEHDFFRSLGQSLHSQDQGHMRGWARVHAECDYQAPLRYGEEIEITLFVREKRPSAISYVFVFRKDDGSEVARGGLTCVCVERKSPGTAMRAVPMPEAIAREVEVAPLDRIQER